MLLALEALSHHWRWKQRCLAAGDLSTIPNLLSDFWTSPWPMLALKQWFHLIEKGPFRPFKDWNVEFCALQAGKTLPNAQGSVKSFRARIFMFLTCSREATSTPQDPSFICEVGRMVLTSEAGWEIHYVKVQT